MIHIYVHITKQNVMHYIELKSERKLKQGLPGCPDGGREEVQ